MTQPSDSSRLTDGGYPENILVLDAETYMDKDYTLKKLSTKEYVYDDRFQVLGWAVKDNDDEPAWLKGDDDAFVSLLRAKDLNDTTIVMHNAKFDALVLAHHYDIHPPFIIDTLDLARHIDSRWKNSLEALAKRHGLKAKGDTSQFMGVTLRDIVTDMVLDERLREYATHDARLTYQLLWILLPYLSNPVSELELAKYTRDLFIYPVLEFDEQRATELLDQMREEMDAAIQTAGITATQARSSKDFPARLQTALGEEPLPTKLGKRGRIPAIAKQDPDFDYLCNHPNEQVRTLMAARIAAKSWPLHMRRIEQIRRAAELDGGKLAVPLRYYGGHTGRWSGSERINLQNLPARGDSIVTKIREVITAPAGHSLLIFDLSQIEARVLAYLADQKDLAEKFRNGEPIYVQFASAVTGKRIRKARKNDSPVVAQWYTKYRNMGKVGILGAGYGMGADRCKDYANNSYGVALTLPEARSLIQTYRRTHPQIVAYWSQVENTFRAATQNPGRVFTLPHGLKFFRRDHFTCIQLPNSRILYYNQVRVTGTADSPQLIMPHPKSKSGDRLYMWGGYLVENIVQAFSRDVLAEAILNIREQFSQRIPLTVHDDVAILIPDTRPDTMVEDIIQLARTPPNWCSDLPVDLEWHLSKEYSK